MQLPMVFETETRNPFRIVDRDGEPWFVLADVCRELDIANPRDAAARLDPDEKDAVGISDAIGRTQQMTIINESGLYSVILRSNKEAAKKFKKWVTSEVLPSIRKTGGYRGKTPAFIKRFNENWDRISPGYFSVISELVIRLHGRLEMVGHVMADRAKNGKENRPDVSVGKLFPAWLEKRYPHLTEQFLYYWHKTPEVKARQYELVVLPMFIEFMDNVWIPEHAAEYFRTRDPAALAYLPKLLPMSHKAKPALPPKPPTSPNRPSA